ncbi:MAG: exodeoxyribonuclease VII large subunit [Oceanicoccus sp.]|uniref:exodeoxyribonuclease VII large subunit n=1 Tax=Oceanicoccus sp. TaxID=2691044 RepID=UPI0026112DEC|nr:exodeoxyribonuclease VII large subunit [Oceanicoccus sp.]MCP3908856.1 exodeoxyribonuclease VII large subunit [Oceanicoccus sp.]
MPSSPTPKKRETLSVSQLNRQAKRLLEGNFPSVWVEGEISNLSRPSSGHWYFSLKDNSAQVRCAMFRSSNARLRFQAEAGQQVMARAKLSLYEARGDYQLIVEHMEPAGDGALARAFEELKNKLQAEGLFDSDIKQAIPDHPKSIAVVTSATGAVIRDILTVLARRFPSIKVSIFPTAVQGQNAAPEIARAINTANALHKSGKREFDVILAGRGGGSMEDLWAFNEEIVARAIYQSDLPVISAVGHEVDFTIADFVADLRAPTPSAAAELISPDGQEMMASFMGFEQLLTRQMLLTLETNKQQLSFLQSRLRHPGSRLQEHSQRLDELEMRLMNGWKNQSQKQQLGLQVLASRLQQQTPDHKIKQLKLSSAGLYQRLEKQVQRLLEQQQLRLKNAMQLLDAVSPLATLDRGYAIVSDDEGQVITDAEELSSGQTINTRFAKGSIKSRVN